MRHDGYVVVRSELNPLERERGFVELHEALLEGDEGLVGGQHLGVMDEGGTVYPAVIETITDHSDGRIYLLRLLSDARV